ncbi:MAG: hypothetical protein OHK0021_03270 [Bryobacter sp.]
MKVTIKLKPLPPGYTMRVTALVLVVVLAVMGITSEWTSRDRANSVEERSRQIWSAYTLLAAAESDYHSTQWHSAAHAAEAEASLRRHLNGFGPLRSREEWDEWRRLAAIVAMRLNSDRQSQTAVADHAFNEQMKAFREAIEQTDRREMQSAAAEVAKRRGELFFRVGLLSGLAAIVLALLYWTPWRQSVRRKRRVERLGI